MGRPRNGPVGASVVVPRVRPMLASVARGEVVPPTLRVGGAGGFPMKAVDALKLAFLGRAATSIVQRSQTEFDIVRDDGSVVSLTLQSGCYAEVIASSRLVADGKVVDVDEGAFLERLSAWADELGGEDDPVFTPIEDGDLVGYRHIPTGTSFFIFASAVVGSDRIATPEARAAFARYARYWPFRPDLGDDPCPH